MYPTSYFIRFKIVILFILFFIIWQALRYFPNLTSIPNKETNSGWEPVVPPTNTVIPVQVTVYYEALCPDSRSFFTKQLLPSFLNAPHLIDVVLVPYGKAKTELFGGEYTFSCQHGPVECQANKIHACVIAKVVKPDIRLGFITCMISDNINPQEIGEKCAKEFGVEWEPISKCSADLEGNELLKQHGVSTNALHPKATFIPTILLNQSQDSQPAILKNLFKEVCRKYEKSKIVECG